MALFKISKGKSTNLPANKVNGYCYVTTDEHKLYVDYTKDDGTLDRFALNATYADTAGSVSKLGTENVGNSNKPIYLESGTPKECVDFLPLSAGEDKKLTGPLGLTENVNYGTSLPANGFEGQLFFLEDNEDDILPISNGGTGATTAAGARANIGAANMVTKTVTLSTSNWSSNVQTVNVSGVTSSNTILVSYNPESYEAYSDAAIRCMGQNNGTLTFSCDSTPSVNISVNVVILS